MELVPSIQQCPDCGRIISFISDKSTITQCASCGAVIRKKASGEIYAGPQLVVVYKNDIIQPGTTGKFNEKSFRVLGRIRVWCSESVFNYWTILFSDGQQALLAEAYGLYSILEAIAVPDDFFLSLQNIESGHTRELIKDELFVLEKKDGCRKWELEGESGIEHAFEQFKIYELASVLERRVTAFVFSKDVHVAYNATYLSFRDLSLQNLRKTTPFAKEIQCKNCSTAIKLKAFPYALSFACPSCCYAHVSENGNDFTIKNKYSPNGATVLPLGAKGSIKGISYEVIGFAEKEELNQYHAKWREYTLYSSTEGFAFLSEYDGHWIYVRETCNAPIVSKQTDTNLEFEGEPFELYNAYNYKMVGACGEFPYNAFDNNNTRVKEYISPPEMWIMEKDGKDNLNWFLGEHINPSQLKNNFTPCNELPQQTGIGALQSKGYVNINKLFVATAIAVLLLLGVHLLINSGAREKMLVSTSYDFTESSDTVNVVTEKFKLDKSYGNLQFKLSGDVDNSWFSVSGTLVNADNGKEYSIEKGIEYYHGYSDGESWSEGSKQDDAYLTNIPSGKYFLQISAIRENTSLNKIGRFNLDVIYDVPSHRNLVFAIVLLLLWPVGWFYRMRYTEKQRWENSPFSKFNYE
ncbi:MAG: DUF4178 domain-containing protein [Chitinophagaceae bacterium]